VYFKEKMLNNSRLVERALYEDVNVFVDYVGHAGANGDDGAAWDDKAGASVTLNRWVKVSKANVLWTFVCCVIFVFIIYLK